MTTMKVSSLKQCPYVFTGNLRVDPTRHGVEKAISEGRFSKRIMDRDHDTVIGPEIESKTRNPVEQDCLAHEYHNERVAELVRTKEDWLDKPDDQWPIKVNQFNQVFAGNHRFRAVRYLKLDEVEVDVDKNEPYQKWDGQDEIWD